MKRKIILISINVLFVIAFFACIGISNAIISPLHSQQAATAWGGQSDGRFAQISAFFPTTHSFEESDVFALRHAVDNALQTVSISTDGENRVYTDAWSATGSVFITGAHDSLPAPVIGVGGDFFIFHPLRLRDGGYITPNDMMRDRVVLDEDLAWRLFGSAQLAGLEVLINNRPFIIAGVIARDNDFATRRAYSGGAGLFMSYEALSAMSEEPVQIVSYEIVMPDPITGFAFNTISEFFSNPDVLVIENSARFALSNAFSAVFSSAERAGDDSRLLPMWGNSTRFFGDRSVRADAITLPYWENAARFAEDMQAILLVISLILLICPIIFSIILLIKLIRFLFKRSKQKIRKTIDAHDRRAYEKYVAEHYPADEDANFSVDQIIREVNGDIF